MGTCKDKSGRELTDLPHFPLSVQQSYLNSFLATVSPLIISYSNNPSLFLDPSRAQRAYHNPQVLQGKPRLNSVNPNANFPHPSRPRQIQSIPDYVPGGRLLGGSYSIFKVVCLFVQKEKKRFDWSISFFCVLRFE